MARSISVLDIGTHMSSAFKQTIENIKVLSAKEKALIAHCLITSLESTRDENVDQAWAELATNRYLELETGSVKGISWNDIKNAAKQSST